MRLFIALPLDSQLREKVQTITTPLRSTTGGARWTEPESWHVTLQFLGQSTDQQLGCLRNGLNAVQTPAFLFSCGGLGCFGDAGVLYLEVGLSRDLAALQKQIVEATSRCGFVPEARVYRPHITLARMKRDAGHIRTKQLQQASSGLRPDGFRSQASQFCLYESRAATGGPRYDVLARFPLQPAGI